MSLRENEKVIRHILAIQKETAKLGLHLEFAERRQSNGIIGCAETLAVVIKFDVNAPSDCEHVFFSFEEARAFLRGLAAAKTFRKED